MWAPFRLDPAALDGTWFRQAHVVRGVARMVEGVPLPRARRELEGVARQLQTEYPELNRGMEAGLTPIQPFLAGDRTTPLLLLLGAVGLLLVLATANVANLLLARAVDRRREFAVRSALGAARRRLLRQALTENLLLALVGGGLGCVFSYLALGTVSRLQPAGLSDLVFRSDWRVLLFASGATLLSAVLFGLVPAVRGSALRPREALVRVGPSRPGGAGRMRLAHSIVTVEVAIALVLLAAAGLLLRSLSVVATTDLGIDPSDVLTFQVSPPVGGYPTDSRRAAFYEEFSERLQALPGVVSAGASRGLPAAGYGWTSDFSIEGWPVDRFGVEVKHRAVTPGYFEAMDVPLLAGRMFPTRLAPDEAVPVVVNRAFVERYFPEGDPVGSRLANDRHPDENSYWYPIVGIVADERMDITGDIEPEVISQIRGDPPGTARFVVETSVQPLDLVGPVRDLLFEIDQRIPLVAVRTMEGVARDATGAERFLVTLLGAFAAIALLLAAVGVYGVAAQAARGRLREVGVRMALGATEGQLLLELMRTTLIWGGAGLVLGSGAALTASRLLDSRLYGIGPADPVTHGAVVLLLAVVTTMAVLMPARRACRTDLVETLRSE
jgi:putative ABC transport system permease protein